VYGNGIDASGAEVTYETWDEFRKDKDRLKLALDLGHLTPEQYELEMDNLRKRDLVADRPGKSVRAFWEYPAPLDMSPVWVAQMLHHPNADPNYVMFYPKCLEEPETCGEIYGHVFGKFDLDNPYPGFDADTIASLANKKRGKWRKIRGTDGIVRRTKRTNNASAGESLAYTVRFFSEFAPTYFGPAGPVPLSESYSIGFKDIGRIEGSVSELYAEFLDMEYGGVSFNEILGINIMCPDEPYPHTPPGWRDERD